jgi:hypothetical protein
VLTHLRFDLVLKHCPDIVGGLVDIGIGGGAFCDLAHAEGWDVDPRALNWLREDDNLWDQDEIEVMTFWDSFEHIQCQGDLLEKVIVGGFVFISTPIYGDQAHALSSKHFKPNEHLWYYTNRGLKITMAESGFKFVDQNRMEESVGREDIGTYVFERV